MIWYIIQKNKKSIQDTNNILTIMIERIIPNGTKEIKEKGFADPKELIYWFLRSLDIHKILSSKSLTHPILGPLSWDSSL